MEEQKRDQYILMMIIGILVITVVAFTVSSIISYQKPKGNEKRIVFNQIYSSDYKIKFIDENYFIGSYEDKSIDVIIDNTGREVVKTNEKIYYDNIYKMKDGRYLFYNNSNDILNVYIFDKVELKLAFSLGNVTYAKPLIHKGDEYDYIVGFYNVIDNDLYIYKLDGTGVTIVKGATIQAEGVENGVYYVNSEKYLVIKNEEGLSSIIDYDGNVIIDYKYNDLMCTKNDVFIALNNKNKYGIIDKNGEVLLKFNYKVIKYYKDGYLVVNNNNKLALFDNEYKNVTGYTMDYDTLISYDLRNKDSLYYGKFNGNVLIADNYMEDINGIEYTKHNLYIWNNDKLWGKIEQKGFFMDTLLFVYDNNYKITIYDENYDIKGEIALDNVSKIDNIRYMAGKTVVIDYLDKDKNSVTKYYDTDGNDISSSYGNLGVLVENNYLYHAFLKDSNNYKILTVYDFKHELSAETGGESVILNREYVIVDNGIYKIEIVE